MAPFTRFQFDGAAATNKTVWQLRPVSEGGSKEGARRRGRWRTAGGFAFFRVGGRCFALALPCPVGEMPGDSDGFIR